MSIISSAVMLDSSLWRYNNKQRSVANELYPKSHCLCLFLGNRYRTMIIVAPVGIARVRRRRSCEVVVIVLRSNTRYLPKYSLKKQFVRPLNPHNSTILSKNDPL